MAMADEYAYTIYSRYLKVVGTSPKVRGAVKLQYHFE